MNRTRQLAQRLVTELMEASSERTPKDRYSNSYTIARAKKAQQNREKEAIRRDKLRGRGKNMGPRRYKPNPYPDPKP